VLLSVIFLLRERMGYSIAFMAAALLSRQYAVLFLVAILIWQWLRFRQAQSRFTGFLLPVIAVLPLLGFMLLWRGIAPPSGLAYWVGESTTLWHPSYLTTYVAFSALYLFPLLLYALRGIHWKEVLMIAPGCVAWYALFPVRASVVTLTQTSLDTVGLAHRVLRAVQLPFAVEEIVLCACFMLGCLMCFMLIREELQRQSWRRPDTALLFTLVTLSFFLVMPASYQVWEKYLILLLPFLSIRLIAFENTVSTHAIPSGGKLLD
jgi:hypothetical protein